MFDTYSTISVVVGALLSSTKAVTKLQGTGAEWAGGWRCQPAASLIISQKDSKKQGGDDSTLQQAPSSNTIFENPE